jgi:hypothetical protein
MRLEMRQSLFQFLRLHQSVPGTENSSSRPSRDLPGTPLLASRQLSPDLLACAYVGAMVEALIAYRGAHLYYIQGELDEVPVELVARADQAALRGREGKSGDSSRLPDGVGIFVFEHCNLLRGSSPETIA